MNLKSIGMLRVSPLIKVLASSTSFLQPFLMKEKYTLHCRLWLEWWLGLSFLWILDFNSQSLKPTITDCTDGFNIGGITVSGKMHPSVYWHMQVKRKRYAACQPLRRYCGELKRINVFFEEWTIILEHLMWFLPNVFVESEDKLSRRDAHSPTCELMVHDSSSDLLTHLSYQI